MNQLSIDSNCRHRFDLVRNEIEKLLNSREDTLLVAIDGMSASGKTTLGDYLQSVFDCNLFHMDGFFLQEEQRTEPRFAEIGGNVDYERFREEVLTPVLNKREVLYRPFHCDTRTIWGEIKKQHKRLNIIEGSYSQHPYFGDVYQLRIFCEIEESEQLARIQTRNGETMLKRFVEEWIPKENAYFHKFGIAQNSFLI